MSKILKLTTVLRSIYYSIAAFVIGFSLFPETRRFFEEMDASWIYILGNALGVSALCVPIVKKAALEFNVVDKPNARKVHENVTPLIGGLAVFIAFLVSLFLNQFFSEELKAIALAGLLIVAVGVFDDAKGLSSTIRLATQLAASGILIYFGIQINLFAEFGLIGEIADILITLLWLIGITNAFNFFDGLDGLATGMAVVMASFFALVGIRSGQIFLSFVSVALAGACLGFIPYNFKKTANASIFLGDTGSTFIGFTLASLAIFGEWSKNEPLKSLTIPILIMSVVIFDMIYITISRFYTGKVSTFKEWLDYVGRDHLHHRLMSLGLSKRQAVFFIYFLCILLGLIAILLKRGETIDVLISLAVATLIYLLVTILMIFGNTKR